MVERVDQFTQSTPDFRIRGQKLEVLVTASIPDTAEFRDYAEIELSDLEGMSPSELQNYVEECCRIHFREAMCDWGIAFDVDKFKELKRAASFETSMDFDVCPECDAVHRADVVCHQCEEDDPDAFETLAEEWERIDNEQYEGASE